MEQVKYCNQGRIWLKRLIREMSLCWLYQADLDNDWDFNIYSFQFLTELFVDEIGNKILIQEKINAKKIYNLFLTNNQILNTEKNAKKIFSILPKLQREEITASFILNPEQGLTQIEKKTVVPIAETTTEEEKDIKTFTQNEISNILLEEMLAFEAKKYIQLIIIHKADLDQQITELSNNWSIDRMNFIDRNLLRLALCEIKYLDRPIKITINEILEISKDYSQTDSFKFINGILGRLL